jgi:ribosomal protein S18 acetylase RimI-like enzyme
LSAEPVIRPATASDVGVIHALVRQLADSTGQQDRFRSHVEDFLEDGFSGDPQFEALLAEQDGAVIGLCLFFYNFSSWRGEPGVYIQDLVVDPQARARGTGRALLQETARHAQQHGATHLRLSVEQDNETAIRFYEALGLRESSNERIFTAFDDDFLNLAEMR